MDNDSTPREVGLSEGLGPTAPKRGLVERLRDDAQGEDLGADGMGWSPDPALKREAADELERLRAFARAVMESWPIGDVDGGDLQDFAAKHGLLTPETKTAPCQEEGCSCAEYYSSDEWAEGITCYRRAEWLRT